MVNSTLILFHLFFSTYSLLFAIKVSILTKSQ
nr:MAG TPA: hypothetical protein [Caudoviricetes sp.]